MSKLAIDKNKYRTVVSMRLKGKRFREISRETGLRLGEVGRIIRQFEDSLVLNYFKRQIEKEEFKFYLIVERETMDLKIAPVFRLERTIGDTFNPFLLSFPDPAGSD